MPEENDENLGNEVELSVALDDLKGHKNDEGLNYFTDEHLEKLGLWGSDDPTKAKFRTSDGKLDVPKIVKSLLERDKQVAKLSNPLPDDASEADRAEHRRNVARSLGVPVTPEEYQVVHPEGVEFEKDDENELKIASHKHNVTEAGLQSFINFLHKREARIRDDYVKSVKEQNDESEKMLKADMGDKFAVNDQLLQRYLHKYCESDDQFDALFKDIKTTLYSGGAGTKTVVIKALCDAANMTEGEGKTIFTQHQERMSEEEELKKEFPESYKDLKG